MGSFFACNSVALYLLVVGSIPSNTEASTILLRRGGFTAFLSFRTIIAAFDSAGEPRVFGNLNHKSSIMSSYYYCHIGILINSAKMHFSLPQPRVQKLGVLAIWLQQATKVGKPVAAKVVARFVGQLWSIDIVCYRAVAIMARGLIRTLTLMVRSPDAMDESNPNRLRYILRRVWGGDVVWTKEAQM